MRIVARALRPTCVGYGLRRPPYVGLRRMSSDERAPLSSDERAPLSSDERAPLSSDERSASLGAYGARGTRGSGVSLMGGKRRGAGALTADEQERLARGEFEDAGVDDTLEAGDVLMEVLAEDHRHKLVKLEFVDDDGQEGGPGASGDGDEKPALTSGPKLAHRRYLTAPGVGPGTAYQRQQASQRQRLEAAEAHAFDYRMPAEAKKQREHERRSRARLRSHDVIENRIQEAMATGAFDNLPGAGKPIQRDENVFESMSGDALAHRVLKNAGIAPGWVEQGKEIRAALLAARSDLAIGWRACVPVWPLPPPDGGDDAEHAPGSPRPADDARDPVVQPSSAAGGWRIYAAPKPLKPGAPAEAAAPTAAGAAPSEATAASEREPQAATAERAAVAALVHAAALQGPRPAQWSQTAEAFRSEMRSLNKMIDSYNLSVPAAWQQVHRLQVERELTRALHEAPQRSLELRAEHRSRRAAAVAGAGGAFVFAGGAAPSFAVREGPMFPSLFDAISSALFAK